MPSNYKDAVAVLKDNVIVGHVPYNLAPRLSQFLRREINNASAVGYGRESKQKSRLRLEIPCVYCLYPPKVYIDKRHTQRTQG